MALRKAEKINAIITQLDSHPLLQENLAKIEDRVNDFVSQFEMGLTTRSKNAGEPRITFTVAYERDGIRELAENIYRDRYSADHYVKDFTLGMPVEIHIKGPQAEQCAELLKDALNYSGIEYREKIIREKEGYYVGCRPYTDQLQQSLDMLHDFAQANFENRQLFHAMQETERKARAVAKAKPGLTADTQIDKSYARNAAGKPVLKMQYGTSDEQLIAFARTQGPDITVRKNTDHGDTHVISGHFKNAAGQQAKCSTILAEILASVERSPVAPSWQAEQAPLEPSKAAKITKREITNVRTR